MKGDRMTRAQLVEGLRAEGLLSAEAGDEASRMLAEGAPGTPWYVRAMVGLGAWLASLLLIGFVAGISLATDGVTVVGLLLVAAAVVLRRQTENDFVVQSTLAASLAGQALFMFGIAQLVPGDAVEVACSVLVAMSIVLFVIFPDPIHRVISVLLAVGALTLLLYASEAQALVPVLGPALAAALVGVNRNRAGLTAGGRGHLVPPLENGLMLAGFGCLLLSTVYLLPELGAFSFYPRPWVSTLLLGALLLYLGRRILPAWAGDSTRDMTRDTTRAAGPVVGVLLVGIIAAAWNAPGLLLALIVLLLGVSSGNRFFTGAGLVFLAAFLALWFYGIEVSLLVKSITLVASGVVVLLTRWLLMRLLSAPRRRERVAAIPPAAPAGRGRVWVVGLLAVVILVVANVQIAGKERILREGATVLLRLAPQDPRSLLQGDYMALRYTMAPEVARAAGDEGVRDGRAIVRLDEDGQAHFVAIHQGQPLAEDQHLLVFRMRGENVRLASDAFFFEEGQWQIHAAAAFGELRVAETGRAVLVGLVDADGRRLGRTGAKTNQADPVLAPPAVSGAPGGG
jgi:uncharacterized membrane-anchored protein